MKSFTETIPSFEVKKKVTTYTLDNTRDFQIIDDVESLPQTERTTYDISIDNSAKNLPKNSLEIKLKSYANVDMFEASLP